MRNEFLLAINQVCAERQLAKEVVLEAVETALITAYRRNFGSAGNITAKIDSETGEALIYTERVVSEEVTDPKSQISLADARAIDPDMNYQDVVLVESTPKDFGRIAAQTAKQVILQRIREAERDALFTVYAEREGEIVNGTLQSIDSQVVIVNLGKAEGTLPRSEQIPGERYRLNQRIRAYVMEVEKSTRGPRIILSRNHRNMLRRLLELEVPEIFNGAVEIKAIAREPGSRSKVAVAALRPGVDPVGSCVGMRGTRIQGIVNELNSEKIDIVEWSSEVTVFIANSLSPAQVISVRLEDSPDGKTATVIVPDKQLSLAIGKEGQNARLAAKLTGWRIDIKSTSEAAAEVFAPEQPETQPVIEADADLIARAEAILASRQAGEVGLTDEELEALPEELAEAFSDMASQAEPMVTEAEEVGEEEIIPAGALEEASPEAAEVSTEVSETQVAVEVPADIAEEDTEAPDIVEVEEAVIEEKPLDLVREHVQESIEGPAATSEPKEELVAEEIEEEGWELVSAGDEEDEFDEEQTDKKKKDQAWRKKHMMVFDEGAGRIVTKRRRKPSRSRDTWEAVDEE